MIHHVWLVSAPPHPVSISKGRVTSKEGDNALVTPLFPFPARTMGTTADVSLCCMQPTLIGQHFTKESLPGPRAKLLALN